MKVRLTSNDMWSPALEFTVERFPVVIGRNSNSDIAVDDRWISAEHCELNSDNGELTVRDLRSKHGTLVNGRPVKHSVVKPGDTLVIGIRSFGVSYRRAARRPRSSANKPKGSSRCSSEETRAIAN